jgi:hypothetical protein
MADDLGARRSAGLSGDDGAQLCGIKTLGKLLDLRGLARCKPTFKRYKFALHTRKIPVIRQLLKAQL